MRNTDLRDVMEEPTHGSNDGRSRSSNPEEGYGKRQLNPENWQGHEFLQEGGFGAIDTTAGTHTGRTYGYQDAGMVVHRGTLHPEDYVHHNELIAGVESHFGFSFDEIRSVYTRAGGPLPSDLRELRSRMDARVLELHQLDHINMAEFARVMGLTEMAMHRALARARNSSNV